MVMNSRVPSLSRARLPNCYLYALAANYVYTRIQNIVVKYVMFIWQLHFCAGAHVPLIPPRKSVVTFPLDNI